MRNAPGRPEAGTERQTDWNRKDNFMIQDIAPEHLDNSFHPARPRPSDPLLCFLKDSREPIVIFSDTFGRRRVFDPVTQEAERFLAQLPGLDVALPERRDRKTVLAHYQQLLRPHTAQALAQVAKSIRFQHRNSRKRMSGAEETFLRRAERQLTGELAKVLQISNEDAQARMEAAYEVCAEK